MEQFDVLYNDKCIGTVRVVEEGLYRRFLGKISLKEKRFYRLFILSDSSFVPVGLCMPVNDGYEIEKSLPARHLPKGKWNFIITEGEITMKQYTPIEEDNPFPLIHRLQYGHLEYNVGKPYFVEDPQSATVK